MTGLKDKEIGKARDNKDFVVDTLLRTSISIRPPELPSRHWQIPIQLLLGVLLQPLIQVKPDSYTMQNHMEVDQLATFLQESDLTSPQAQDGIHILRFLFPSPALTDYMQLTEQELIPYLPAPRDSEYRTQPSDDPSISGVFDTSMSIAMPVSQQASRSFEETEHTYLPTLLLNLVRSCSEARGYSELEILALKSPDHDSSTMKTYFRLTTWPEMRELSLTIPLDTKELTTLLAFSAEEKWIAMLKNVFFRESDRAYHHVRTEFLQRFDSHDLRQADGHVIWGVYTYRSVRDVVYARIDPMTNLFGDNNGRPQILLPCSDIVAFEDISIDTVEHANCPRCGVGLLQPSDYDELAVIRSNQIRLEYIRLNNEWLQIERQTVINYQSEQAPSHILIALKVALRSLRAPKEICPKELVCARFEETKILMQNLEHMLTSGTFYFKDTADVLRSALIQFANDDPDLVSEHSPRHEWSTFLGIWMKRTVHFLCNRYCNIQCSNHAGVHEHPAQHYYDPGLYYNPTPWNAPDDQEEVDALLTELSGLGMDVEDVVE